MPASDTDWQQSRPRASGDSAAAEAGTALVLDLFERYHKEIYAYLCGMVRNRAWAEDLAQETFLHALRARRQLPEVQNHRAWLYRVATNAALNALKRRRRFIWLPWQAGGREGSAPDVAEQVGRQSALETALASLPPGFRASLLLYAQYALSPAEVAAALGMSEAAARKRIYRATALFRQAYGKGDAR